MGVSSTARSSSVSAVSRIDRCKPPQGPLCTKRYWTGEGTGLDIRVTHVWSPLIQQDESGPPLLYLDQMHWVGLAKANAGSGGEPAYKELLHQLRQARYAAQVVVPLSATHYMELSGVASHRQRSDVAAVMAELSSFATLAPRVAVMGLELEAMLDRVVGPAQPSLPALPLVGHGWRHTFGVVGGFRLGGDPDTIARLAAMHPNGQTGLEAEAEALAEPMMLIGPDDLAAAHQHGYVQYAARNGQARRAEQEMDLRDVLNSNPQWRQGRIRDVVTFRYARFELHEMLPSALASRGATGDELWGDRDEIRGFVDAMPSADVQVSIQTRPSSQPRGSMDTKRLLRRRRDVDRSAVLPDRRNGTASSTRSACRGLRRPIRHEDHRQPARSDRGCFHLTSQPLTTARREHRINSHPSHRLPFRSSVTTPPDVGQSWCSGITASGCWASTATNRSWVAASSAFMSSGRSRHWARHHKVSTSYSR